MTDTNIPNPKDIGEGINEASKGLTRLFCGWPRRNAVNAEIKATKDIIDVIDQIRIDGMQRGFTDDLIDGLCRDAVQRMGKIENYEKVVSFAERRVEPDADAERLVGSEWLYYFRDHSEKVTDADVQAVWSAILAEEINCPGAVSKRTMSILADMGKREIDWFRDLCAKSCYVSTKKLDYHIDEVAILADRMAHQENVLELMGLGLVQRADQKRTIGPGDKAYFLVNETIVTAENETNKSVDIKFNLILTQSGKELAKLCSMDFGKDSNTYNELVELLKKQSMAVSVEQGSFGFKNNDGSSDHDDSKR